MKPQDVLFIIVMAILLFKRRPKHLALAGLTCLTLAIPLFQLLIFFTAERLVVYAAVFILIAVLFKIKSS